MPGRLEVVGELLAAVIGRRRQSPVVTGAPVVTLICGDDRALSARLVSFVVGRFFIGIRLDVRHIAGAVPLINVNISVEIRGRLRELCSHAGWPRSQRTIRACAAARDKLMTSWSSS